MADTLDAAWFASTYEQVKNWGRWGADDELGALNLITPERRAAATALVTDGRALSLAFDLETVPGPDNPEPAHHHMLNAADARKFELLPGFEQTTCYLGVACHGMAVTHIDALCHIFVDGLMWNGRPTDEVLSTGAVRNAIGAVADGICGRGVLLDVPRQRGIEWLDPSERITPADLEACEAATGVTVGPGDIVLISNGRARRRHAEGAGIIAEGFPGLHPTCLPWLRERDVAALGSDGISDALDHSAFGATDRGPWPMPIHQIGIAAIGLHLLDNLDLTGLADTCAELGRWAFLLTIAPLRIPKGTGCAVNPIAVF
jgi:kynurenine formamidase